MSQEKWCASPKTNMNAENTYLEKEKHRTKPPFLVFKMLIIADVYTFQQDIKGSSRYVGP